MKIVTRKVSDIYMKEKKSFKSEGTPEKKSKRRELPVGLIAVAVVLAVTLTIMVVAYQRQKSEMFEMEQMLTNERDSLEQELRLMVFAYDTLMTDNDSLNAKLQKEQEYIERLLAINASNVETIRAYRAEIGTMRNIMKSYIVQIDSLNMRNQMLTAENVEIRTQIQQVSRTNVELERQREDLSAKVEVASVVYARNVIVTGLNQRRRETDRINRLARVQVCFTLRENPIAEAGEKRVYLRIIRPDGLVITDSPGNTFQVDGEDMVFSASRAVDYENRDLDVCIFVENRGDFIEGVLTAELYLDGVLIGNTEFSLR